MISIVIPTYNEEARITRCLSALSRQTVDRDQYELIVVDGDSKDKTREFASAYADKVFIQRSERVGGARNDGIIESVYDLVGTTDADSIIPENWVEELIRSFKRPDVVQAYGPVTTIENNAKNRMYATFFNTMIWAGAGTGLWHYTLGCNTAFRKDAFIKAGMYRTYDAGDDLEIPLRMKKEGRIHFNPNLVIGFDFRRYEEYGFWKTLLEWYYVVLSGGESDKVRYSRREYCPCPDPGEKTGMAAGCSGDGNRPQ